MDLSLQNCKNQLLPRPDVYLRTDPLLFLKWHTFLQALPECIANASYRKKQFPIRCHSHFYLLKGQHMKRVRDQHMKPAILLHDHVSVNNAEANRSPGKWVFSWKVYWFDCYPAR